MYQPELAGPRLRLRCFVDEDAAAACALAGDTRIADTTASIPHPYTLPQARQWIGSLPDARQAGRSLSWAVTLEGELVGACSLAGVSLAHRHGELAYWIGVPWWGKGLATEAARLLLAFGFGELGLERIGGACFARNPGSARVLEKLGMTYEGCQRRAMLKNGRFEDLLTYALLRDEFPGLAGQEDSPT